MSQTVLVTGVDRRRRWSDESRRQILEEAFSPGAVISQVAWRHDVSTGLLYTWRRKMDAAARTPAFLPAVITEEPVATLVPPPAVVVELGRDIRVRIDASAPDRIIAATLRALR